MSAKMLGFVHTAAQTPEKRPADARSGDFHEIYAGFIADKAREQANRCSQCGVPFCQVHCPLQNNIPDWLKLTAEGRLEEAYEISSATNNFPEICGRICPQDRLCEGNCVVETSGHGAVTIGAVEKYITDTAWMNGWVKPIRPKQERPQSVGIVGGGPAGMAAAEQLRRQGWQVHVYDRHDRLGGLLTYGIPSFKLEKEIVERRTQRLLDSGVQIHLNADVGGALSFDTLRARHDAVLIATGVYKARALDLPADHANVIPALDYLTASNRVGFGDKVPDFDNGRLNASGKRVVVIGGGDTAMDCVRTAVRQGATEVTCLYRRDRANMPGSQREVAHAEEEGVTFVWQAAPEGFTVVDGRVTQVLAHRIALGARDASGRAAPTKVEGSTFALDADLVVTALGFEPEDLPTLFGQKELVVTKWGTVKIDNRTLMTNLPGVFAAGDIARGASLVVWAVRDGRDAAAGIHKYLTAKATEAVATAAE